MFGRSHALGPAGDLDGIGIHNANTLQEFPETQLKAVVEAPQDGRVAVIFLTRGIEVEHFFQGTSSPNLFPPLILSEKIRSGSFLRVESCIPFAFSANPRRTLRFEIFCT